MKTASATKSLLLAAFAAGFAIVINIDGASAEDSGNDNSVKAKVERAADKTGAALNNGAEKTKQGLTTAAEHTERGLKTAAKHTDRALHKAADKTEAALQKVGAKIQEVVVGDAQEK